jgi:hypothetical protein
VNRPVRSRHDGLCARVEVLRPPPISI